MDIEMQRKEYPQAASSAIAQGIENLKKKKKTKCVTLGERCLAGRIVKNLQNVNTKRDGNALELAIKLGVME